MCGKDRIDSHLTGGLIGKSKSEMPSSPAISSTSSDKPDKYAEPSRRLPQYALSVAECLTLSEQAKFMCEAQFPYRVVYVNRSWSELTGFQQHELVGGNLNDLQGPLTDKKRIFYMLDKLRTKGLCEKEVVINYTKDRTPICCELNIYPVMVEPTGPDEEYQTAFYLTTVTQLHLQPGVNLYIKRDRSPYSNHAGEGLDSLIDYDRDSGDDADLSSGSSQEKPKKDSDNFEINSLRDYPESIPTHSKKRKFDAFTS